MSERRQRRFIHGLLVLLCIPGIIGFDLWPLTGWRLFSLSRTDAQTEWALDAETPAGTVPVDLEQLPLAFRNAAWPLADLPMASAEHREAVCVALLGSVRDIVPDVARLVLVLEGHELRDEGRVVTMRARFHACTPTR